MGELLEGCGRGTAALTLGGGAELRPPKRALDVRAAIRAAVFAVRGVSAEP